jgi:hypothetical protein
MGRGEDMPPKLEREFSAIDFSGIDKGGVSERIMDAFAQHPEFTKILNKPALSFSREAAEDLVSKQLKALTLLTPESDPLRDHFHKCQKSTKKAHELCNGFLDISERISRFPSTYTPDPAKGHEVLIAGLALERVKKIEASKLKDTTVLLGELKLGWIAKRSSDNEDFIDYIERTVPNAFDQ